MNGIHPWTRTIALFLGRIALCLGIFAAAIGSVQAQPPVAPQDATATAEEQGAAQERDRAFQELLGGVRLSGFFTASDAPADRPLARDEYVLTKVERLPGTEHTWVFHSRVKWGKNEFALPLALDVRWAGDTPMITMTDVAIPGFGTFTARVLFYDGQYAGTWSSPKHFGQMFGEILPLEEESGAEGVDDGGGAAADGARESGGDAGSARAGALDADEPEGNAPHLDETVLDAELVARSRTSDDSRWPSFRGHHARGVGGDGALPTEWDVASGAGVEWKEFVPGLCHSCPVVWDDVLFVTSVIDSDSTESPLKVGLYGSIEPVADEGEQEFVLFCFDRADGGLLWEQVLHVGTPAIARHPKGSHAASTPATDGEHIVVFLGSEGLHCLDMDGELLWSKDFGVLDSGYFMVKSAQWGWASSPTLFEGKVIVQVDVQDEDFVACFDAATGDELWRTPRVDEPTWSTPTVDVRNGRRQVIVNGYRCIASYDLDTGEELWSLEGGGDIPVPTPIVAHDLIYITNAHGRMAPILAIDALASGRLTMDAESCEGWCGATTASATTCRHRWCSETSSICAPTAASSVVWTRRRERSSIASASASDRMASRRLRWRRTANSTTPAKRDACMSSALVVSTNCWQSTSSARSAWRRRRSPMVGCTFVLAIS